MASGMNMIVRRIQNLRGFILNECNPAYTGVRSISTKIESFPSSSQILKTFTPPSSVDYKDASLTKINILQFTTPRLPILDRPFPINNGYKIDLPVIRTNIRYEDIKPVVEIQDPNPSNHEEKHAIRMIVIRKRKMRVHKLKKLRKKMKFVWGKIKQRRRAEKEKVFQAALMAKIKEAEKFDPATYIKEKIAKSNEVLIPKLWRNKRLPEFIIKDLIELKIRKKQAREDRAMRRRNMNVKASDY